jgi:nicotinamide riboside kinase
MARRFDGTILRTKITDTVDDVVRVVEANWKRKVEDHAELLRRLEAAARRGALLSGAAGAAWGIA